MMKCPFCQFDNEDGALFCEQCKSDLGFAVEATPVAEAAAAEPAFGEAVPMAAVADAPPMAEMPVAGVAVAEPIADAVPAAEAPHFDPFAAEPPPAAPVFEASPFEQAGVTAEPVMEAAPVVAEAAPVFEPIAPPPPAPEPPPVAAAEPVAPTTPAMPAAAPPPAPAAPIAPAGANALPAGANPRLVVMRGLKLNVEYPIYEGMNFIGRADEKPVDIDLEDQEPPDRIWSSRQHALITYEEGALQIEDLNSSNGTFVNRNRIYPGQKRPLNVNDVVQIGTVQMKLKV